MKNTFVSIILLGMLVFSSPSVAQGIRVVYSMQMKVPTHEGLNDPMIRAAVEAQLKSMNKNFVLLHHQGESLYFPEVASQSTNQMGGSAVIYKNQRDKQMVSQDNILDRQFLIAEPLSPFQWTLSSETKRIGNHVCNKAVSESSEVTAWYSPDLPINDGPGRHWGLPGLILELDTQVATITAQDINLNYDTSGKITAPTSGKSVSRQEFNEIRDQRLKEMGVDGVVEGSSVRVIRL